MENRPCLGYASIAAVVVLVGSCGSNAGKGFVPTPDGGDAIDGSGGSSGSSSGGLVGDDGSGGCPDRCSSDLHSLVDCNGNVIMTCPADQGCSGSGCVPACQSAEANKSTFGCEYYSVDPDSIVDARGDCFALFIANTWTTPAHVTADWAGQSIDIASNAYLPTGTGASLTYAALGSNALQPNQVAIVFLNDWPSGHGLVPPGLDYDCPKGVNVAFTTQDGAVHGPATGQAFHFTTDVPVVAYDMLPYGGGRSALTSATLLLPTSAWDVNYVGVNAYQQDVLTAEGQGFLQIVASQSSTTVTVQPTAAIVAGNGVAATAAGMVGTYTLANAGDYVQFTQNAELTGTAILADKPVGVWGGATCMNIDVNTAACDTGHQQLFPVQTLGHEYVAARYRDRFPGSVESTPYRIVGAVNGTQLTYNPSTPSGAPTTIDQGAVVTFWTQDPFVVSSQDDQHPFFLSAHMSGADTVDPSESDARGGSRVRERHPAAGVPDVVRVLHRPDVPGDQPGARPGEGDLRLPGREPRLPRNRRRLDVGGHRWPVRDDAGGSVDGQLPGRRVVQQRAARGHQQRAVWADGVGLGLGRHGHAGRCGHLLAVRELRLPRGRQRAAHQHGGGAAEPVKRSLAVGLRSLGQLVQRRAADCVTASCSLVLRTSSRLWRSTPNRSFRHTVASTRPRYRCSSR